MTKKTTSWKAIGLTAVVLGGSLALGAIVSRTGNVEADLEAPRAAVDEPVRQKEEGASRPEPAPDRSDRESVPGPPAPQFGPPAPPAAESVPDAAPPVPEELLRDKIEGILRERELSQKERGQLREMLWLLDSARAK